MAFRLKSRKEEDPCQIIHSVQNVTKQKQNKPIIQPKQQGEREVQIKHH